MVPFFFLFVIQLFTAIATSAAQEAVVAPGVTDQEVVLGQSAAFSGTSAALGTELWRGADAYFKEYNENVGAHERKVKIQIRDDSYDGDLTIKNTIELITKEQVFALFGYVGTPTLA